MTKGLVLWKTLEMLLLVQWIDWEEDSVMGVAAAPVVGEEVL